MKKIKQYQAVFESKNGRFFRVNGAVGRTEYEAEQLASNHVLVKDGAELSHFDSWFVWEDEIKENY